VYPLPTRVTTRLRDRLRRRGPRLDLELDSTPTWQIEGGIPRVLRLDPRGGGGAIAASDPPPRDASR
jgi:hypothetical protein